MLIKAADYVRFFNTVEIDRWFSSLFPQGTKLPDSQTVRLYAESAPDDFLFTAKITNMANWGGKFPAGQWKRGENVRGGTIATTPPALCRGGFYHGVPARA